ncbi:unnamed protein product [Calypogeia fissa]
MEMEKKQSTDLEGERETSGMPLPVELVERILAMVPFPFIFKARALSKSWLARLSSISPTDYKEKKHLDVPFQEQVCEFSKKWKTFCPIFVSKEGSIGYDRTSQHWQPIMPSLYFLPENFFTGFAWSRIEGSLVLVSTEKTEEEIDACEDPDDYNENVVNIVTRRYEQLPSPPPADYRTHMGEKWVIPMSSQTFRAVIFHEDFHRCFVDVYDSESRVWSNAKVDGWGHFHDIYLSNWAHLNGVFYKMVGPTDDTRDLLAFDVQERTFKLLQMPAIDIPLYTGYVVLMGCNGNLLMLVFDTGCEDVFVMKIDVRRRRWVDVSEGPPAELNFGRFLSEPAADDECIYFMGEDVESGLLVYNMKNDEWSTLHIPESVRGSYIGPMPYQNRFHPGRFQWNVSCFRPGLSPFLAI